MIYDKFLEGNQNIKINIKIHSRSINKIRGISDEESEWRKKRNEKIMEEMEKEDIITSSL